MNESGRLARSFGRVALEYEHGRPDWPDEAFDRAAEALGLDADATVVDLAAGTGKLAAHLVGRFRHVVTIEPDAEMRRLLEASVPLAVSLAGTAEKIPLSRASAHAVFVGDAFHWFDGTVALAEIARILRPRGGLVLFWNNWRGRDFEPRLPDAIRDRLQEIYDRSGRAASSLYPGEAWREAFASSPFAPITDETIERELVLTADQVVSLWLSVSSVASLPDPERSALAEELRQAVSGTYRLPIRTDVHWTHLAEPARDAPIAG